MEEHEILRRFEKIKRDFGAKCKKLSGSVTIELLREAFSKQGVEVSDRDVYIRGVPIEIDLVFPVRRVKPISGLIYEPEDVLAAFEIKTIGCFGKKSIDSVRNCFHRIQSANPKIYCAYISLSERAGYKWAARPENVGADTFTLFWHDGKSLDRIYTPSGDWTRLIRKLKKLDH